MSTCLCRGCDESFTCLSAFEMHRVGSFGEPIYAKSRTGKSQRVIGYTPCERRCFAEQEMLAKGMVRNDKGRWLTRPAGGHWTEHREEEAYEEATS